MAHDWDHEVYRTPFEPLEHWQLKEEFILAHKGEIKEDELVCLASVYVNMQLLGCRYPASVAKRIHLLSRGLGSSYRQWRAGKLMRTFVKASDAAVAKIRRSDAPTTLGVQDEESSDGRGSGKVKKGGGVVADDGVCEVVGDTAGEIPTVKKKKKKKKGDVVEPECEEVDEVVEDTAGEVHTVKKKKKKGDVVEPGCEEVDEVVEDTAGEVHTVKKKKKKKDAVVEPECEEVDDVVEDTAGEVHTVKKKKKKKKKKGAVVEPGCEEVDDVSLKRKASEDNLLGNGLPKKKRKSNLAQEAELSQDSSEVEVLDVLPKGTKLTKKLDSTVDVDSDSPTEDRPAFSASDAVERLSSKIKKRKLKADSSTIAGSPAPEGGNSIGLSKQKRKVSMASLADEDSAFYGLIFVKLDNRQKQAVEVLNNFFPNGDYRVEENQSAGCMAAYVKNTEVARLPLGGSPKKDMRQKLAKKALKVLVKRCPLLVLKSDSRETNVGTDGSLLGMEDYTSEKIEQISKDNVGSKMLQLMGWTGGGLGKNETGRVNPVEVSMLDRRAGLGYSNVSSMGVSGDFKRKVDALLKNFTRDYMNGATKLEELVFPSVFSKEQRAYIHQIVCKSRLQSTSYGKGKGRYLVVKPKMAHYVRAMQVLDKGGETSRYRTYLPGDYDVSVFNLKDV